MDRLYLDEFNPQTELVTAVNDVRTPRFPVIDMHAHLGPMLLGSDYAQAYDTLSLKQTLQACGVERMVSLELVWDDAYARLLEKLAPGGDFFAVFPSVDVSRFEDSGFESMVYRTLASYKRDGVKGIKLWKNITLSVTGSSGARLRLDEPRLAPVFAYAGALGIPIVIHIGDPPPFFKPNGAGNEYYSCLYKHPEWSFCKPGMPSFEAHLEMQEKMLAAHPATQFVIAHIGSYAENLARVSEWLVRYPNMNVDISARVDQLGRQPFAAREFLIAHQDRILFGTDFETGITPPDFYATHYRFMETKDEYFDHPFAGFLCKWKIYGVDLPAPVLEKIYRLNARRILGL